MGWTLRAARAASSWLAPAELAHLDTLGFHDAGHGCDVLGLDPRWVQAVAGPALLLHHRYFRVTSQGFEHLPAGGPAILASNHSGMLPIDAAMLWTDVLLKTKPARVARVVLDRFVPLMPVIGTLFSRVGAVAGTPGNFRALLEAGELVLVFPEGVPGIGKGFRRRYELQDWRRGHAELALQHRVAVVPVAVVGAEEAWPQLARLDHVRLLGAPYLPLPLTPLPLPARLHLLYGAPIHLHEEFPAEEADDPAVSERAALRVKGAVEALIAQGRRERRGVFR